MTPKANKQLSKDSVANKKKQIVNTRKASYKLYLFKLLKKIHPQFEVSSNAMELMNCFINDIFEKVVEESSKLALYNKKKTITSREIQTAVKLVLPPGELVKHAIVEGIMAVVKFRSS